MSQTVTTPSRPYAIGAEFTSAGALLAAAEKLREKGYKWWDAYSHVPIHGMDKAKGSGKSWLSAWSLFCGLIGFSVGLGLQTLTAIDRPEFLSHISPGYYLNLFYPTVTSGKPYFSLPGNFPVLAVVTIMLTGYGTFLGVLLFNFLPRFHQPIFNWDRYCKKATNDGFFIAIEVTDPRYSEIETPRLLEELGGQHIELIPR